MKNFIDINVATLSKAFIIDGVATRLQFWYFVLFTWVVDIGASIFDIFIPGDFIANILSILLFVPSVTVAIRRMHDVNRAGWWILVPFANLYFLITPSKPNRWEQ
jgi:uncharacterized membrane protein YhaH (DUF805 family)